MQRIKQYIAGICLFSCALFISCNEGDKGELFPSGSLFLDVEQDITMITKAEATVGTEALRVDIINAEEDTVKTYNDYLTEVKGEKLILPVGTYTVAVRSNQEKKADWETPFYTGEEEVVVKAGEITSAKVICKIANTKVSVVYGASVQQYFIDYQTDVTNSSGTLHYTRDEYRSGFFTPEKLTTKLYLTNKDGNKFTIQRVFPDIKERYHYILRFTIADGGEEEEAGGKFDITVNEESKTVDCDIFINMEDELVGKGVPSLKLAGGFNEENVITFKVGSDIPSGSLAISSANGIERLAVEVKSNQLQILGLTSFDLAKLDASTKATLTSIDFPLLADQQNMKNILLDFDKLAVNLKPLTEDQIGTHSFTIYAMDSLHQEKEIKFTYIVRPDVPAITNKPNVFSTFAFLSGESTEANGQGFRYKKVGDTDYQEIIAEKVNADGSFSAVLKSLNPGEKYEYYAIAGTDSKGGVQTFITENASPLINGGFEIWNSNDPSDGTTPFWGSGNNTVIKDLTSPTTEVATSSTNNKKAAKLQSQKPIAIVALAAGNLFTGDFDMDGMGGKLTFGRIFPSRPSKLKGYYKYTPGTIDASGSITLPSGAKVDVKKGDTDTCSIYIALSKEPYQINTNKPESLFDMNTDKFKDLIVAYAELPTNQSVSTAGKYEPFELDLKYLQQDYSGKLYIVIVCSAGKYGDYFKGSTSSLLLLDEFELGYDYNENSFINN